MSRIVVLEHELDVALSDVRDTGRPRAELTARAMAWSTAVWDAARQPPPLSGADVDRGLAVARRPVFVCGVHRSGTTLVRDLLDGHPALAVLPSEGSFYTSLEARMASSSAGHAAAMGREWLRRLANPINQPPFWLLGRSSDDGSRYIEFAERFQAWWTALEQALAPRVAQWPLVAAALAYGDVTAHRHATPSRRWVEKTPTNERFADRLYADFPEARIIHVIRAPEAVLASRKALEERSTGSFRGIRRVLDDLAFSYASAAERTSAEWTHRYLVVRYEDLVRNPEAVTRRMAAFIGVDWLPVLRQPMVAGQLVSPNSSFASTGAAGEIAGAGRTQNVLTTWERDLLAAATGDLARRVGYVEGERASWRARLLTPVVRMLGNRRRPS